MGEYLIPANSKKSLLIFGIFKKEELIMFGICLLATLGTLMLLPIDDIKMAVLALSPALIGGLLIMPVPNYHNVLTIIIAAYTFVTSRQKYVWRGWCLFNGKEKNK